MRVDRATRLAAMAALLLQGCQQRATEPWLTMPSVAEHAGHFPIGPSNVHGARPGQSPVCDACHLDKATGLPSSTFRTFTCTGCHVSIRVGVLHDSATDLETFHAALPVPVANYATTVASYASSVASLNGGVGPQAAEDGACLACHPTGMATDHAAVYPLPHRNAAGTLVAICADCHLDYANRLSLGCAGCHPHDQPATATAHAAVPGFAAAASALPADVIAASTLCVRCHGDATVPVTVAGHATRSRGFVLGPGFHTGATAGGCLDCHPALRPAKTFAADFSRFTCGTGISCHGAVPMTIAGAHDDPLALGSFHATQGADFAGTVALLGFDAACLSCHPDGGAGLPANHPFPVGAATGHALTCSGCHTTLTNRNNPANFACASSACHTGATSLGTRHSTPVIPVTDYVATSTRCLYCHGDSQVNRAADHPVGDGTPFANNAQHLTAGCSNCHRIARTDKPFAANWGATDCRGCHDTAGGPSEL